MVVNDGQGGNTSLVIEDAPESVLQTEEDSRAYHIVTLSARTSASLRENHKRLLDYLTRHSDTKLANLAYTTTARRMHEVLRVAYTAKSTNEIVRLLRADMVKEAMDSPTKRRGIDVPSVCFYRSGLPVCWDG